MGDIPRPLLTNRFTEAIDFALVAHCAQVRKGTRIPYLSHLLAVASLVIEHDGDEDAAIAAVLHDAPEDQGGQAMVEQIRARFGAGVADIVVACTDTFESPKPAWPPRKTKYVEHLAAGASTEACIVSAADKLHNARAILHDLRGSDDHAAFWKRFGSSPTQIGWYYGRLERALDGRLVAHDEGAHLEDRRIGDHDVAFDGRRAVPGEVLEVRGVVESLGDREVRQQRLAGCQPPRDRE